MNGLEEIVPQDKRFNAVAIDYQALLREYIEGIRERSGDILDVGTEYHVFSEQWDNFFSVISSSILAPNSSTPHKAMLATRRGFIFGLEVAEQLSSVQLSGLSMKYFLQVPDEDPSSMIRHDIEDYLGRNQAIDQFIWYYMAELDVDEGTYNHTIELAAGLALRLAEDAMGADILSREIDTFRLE